MRIGASEHAISRAALCVYSVISPLFEAVTIDEAMSVRLFTLSLLSPLSRHQTLQDRALALLRAAEALVKAGTYARHEPATRAYAVLEICTQLMELTERRRGLLTGAARFFTQAQKVAAEVATGSVDWIQGG